MAKLVILRGLPASGKSLLAAKYVLQGYKRINSDDLRLSIDNGVYSKDNEKVINLLINNMLHLFFKQNYNVVLDNTNLNPHRINSAIEISKNYGTEIEIIDVDTPLEVCLQRDLERTQGRVGRDTIINMYNKWFKSGKFPKIY